MTNALVRKTMVALTGKTKQVHLTFQPQLVVVAALGWVGGAFTTEAAGLVVSPWLAQCTHSLCDDSGALTVLRGLCLDIGYTELLLGSELNFPAFTSIG